VAGVLIPPRRADRNAFQRCAVFAFEHDKAGQHRLGPGRAARARGQNAADDDPDPLPDASFHEDPCWRVAAARPFLVMLDCLPALIDPHRPMGLDGISAEHCISSQISLSLGRNFQGEFGGQRTEPQRDVLFQSNSS
jgi:hypothetical protein